MTELSEIIAKVKELLPNVTPGPWKRFVPDRGYCIDYIVTEAPLAKNEERHSDIVAETTNSTGPRSTSFFEKDSEWIALLDPVNVSALLTKLEDTEADYFRRHNDAVDHLERALIAESRLAEAAKALEPFAAEAACYDPDDGDGDDTCWATPAYFKIRDLRRARALIPEKKEG